MSNELKPCPFCGGGNIRQSNERDCSIVCSDCDVVFTLLVQPFQRGWASGSRDAWNARAEPTGKVQPLEWEKISTGVSSEIDALRAELADIKARSCEGCKWFENSQDYGGEGFCSHALIPFVRTYETLCCSKWEPKT